jgi:hypothetical protein
MKELDTALIYIAVLYGVDALFFDGGYFAVLDHMLSQIYMHW